jgi:multisubunit Na+/H+ antiporter MnhB subunit
MMKLDNPSSWFSLPRFLVFLLTLLLTFALGMTLFSLPPAPFQLLDTIHRSLPHSGVTNPVTAVLLNFRAYDTLLEIGVLLVAVFGIRAFPEAFQEHSSSLPAPSEVLLALVRLLVPLMVLIAGYLLWAGSHAPGGAFQAGAVLGAGAVLILLAGLPLSKWFHGWWFRAALILGFMLFLGVGFWAMAMEGHFLEYPRDRAEDLILLIEAALTVSIGCILATLFLGLPDAAPVKDAANEKS